jgi:hypothetical protein
MARTQEVIESVTCDICGKAVDKPSTVALGWDADRWEVDLCAVDYKKVSAQFDKWIAEGRPVRATKRSTSRRAPAKKTADDWAYLESLGFVRHRGRKRPEEVSALAARKS